MKVGGTAWELKIDRKRLQKKENNDLKEGGERTNEQKHTHMAKIRSNNKILLYLKNVAREPKNVGR